MKTEFEIKFLAIDKDKIRNKLEKIGAKCIKKETLMKRVVYDLGKSKYARIRDEGDKITCTYKEIGKDTSKIDCVKEIETTVGDFDKMKQIFEKIWAKQKSYQETKREIWKIENECEFMIDTWPGLNPFLEIEAESEEIVKKYVEKLGFDYKNGIFGAVDEIASIELGLDKDYINSVEEITFEKPLKNYNVLIKEFKSLDKDILEKTNLNNGFLYIQELDNNKVGVYRPFEVEITYGLKGEIENVLGQITEKLYKNEKEKILQENIFRVDGVIDENNNFKIVEINSHFPRLYMLNQESMRRYKLDLEYKKFFENIKNLFLDNGKYEKINIIYDENIDSIKYNLGAFLENFGSIIDNVYSLKDCENNFEQVKKSLEKNPNVYRMVIQIKRLENFLENLDLNNLRMINSLKAGEIGKKANLSLIQSPILPKTEKYLVKDLGQEFIVPKNKVLKISYSTEGKGVFLPNEKVKFDNDEINEKVVLQDYVNISSMKLQNGERKYNDINFFIVRGKVIGAIIRLSYKKIVNVSAGGSFASCILKIK